MTMSSAIFAALLAFLPGLVQADNQSTAAKVLKEIQDDRKKIDEKYNAIYEKAKSDREHEQIFEPKRKEIQECVQRALQLATEHPDDPAAFDARVWIVTGGLGYFPETWKAMAQIQERDLRNPKLGAVCLHARVYRLSYAGTEQFLRAVLEQNPDRTVQGLATYALAAVLQEYARILKDPKKAKRLESAFAPELLQRLRTRGPDKLSRESEELYQGAADKYGDVKFPSGTRTIRPWAEGALFELRNLQVGKAAPEIEGEDIDGRKFRLSDYRGKVILLDFWGHW
jgi:hypothetical protein